MDGPVRWRAESPAEVGMDQAVKGPLESLGFIQRALQHPKVLSTGGIWTDMHLERAGWKEGAMVQDRVHSLQI